MSSYDQAASAKWANLWFCLIAVSLIFIRIRLRGIERAIREARVEVRVQSGEDQK